MQTGLLFGPQNYAKTQYFRKIYMLETMLHGGTNELGYQV